ncbi:MAG TPA: CRISPR-associated protein Cas4 [Clostridiales bacterium]|nr:MAG: PD-(D/E)XK nuclease superfamily protein [Firmicutes bacterium ADurb.Bin262]HOU09673.1 CRISPR-associated protein Cas4 [Clostridiales bacterium]HQH62106.1 CRISPR-associated protein Cas4 [Clostridiales bacterium]HQK74319.1 CRISPR-associated protein Cas4 [Clostridiales bacterium]
MYEEEDYLQLSGIQHFVFCRRQWALIHIEQQWADNLRTVEGEILHEKAHDSYAKEKRNDLIVSRGMPVFSKMMGVNGVCDIVELHKDPKGVRIFGKEGLYKPIPVEYKRGKPKQTEEDVLQLTAQALCLEEMLLCDIPLGYLFYGEINHRVQVNFDEKIRKQVVETFAEMHEVYNRRYTPKVKTGKHCRACSMADICLPKLCKNKSAANYIRVNLAEAER